MRNKMVMLVLFSVLISSFVIFPGNTINGCFNSDLSGSASQLNNSTIKENNFTISADGDVSSESITSFSETSDDDIFLYSDSDIGGSSQYSSMFTTDESIDSDVPLDPDTDTNGDAIYSEWGSGESIEDDVLLYPDGIVCGDYHVPTAYNVYDDESVSGSLSDLYYVDSDYMLFTEDDAYDDVKVNFTFNLVSNEEEGVIFYAGLYCFEIVGEYSDGVYFYVYNYETDSFEELFYLSPPSSPSAFDPGYEFDNASIEGDEYFNNGEFVIFIQNEIYYNKIYLTQCAYRAVADTSSSYIETFRDVDDWSYYSNSFISSYSFSTDNDVVTFSAVFDDANDEFVDYQVNILGIDLSTDIYYCEVRYKTSDTNVQLGILFRFTDSTSIWFEHTLKSTTWTTYCACISSTKTIDKILLRLDDVDGSWGDGNVHSAYLDYLRIAPADQMGWQHDGSTTSGLTHGAYMTVTTDGDVLTCTETSAVQALYLKVDTTSTRSCMPTSYYPFVEWRITAVTDVGTSGQVWLARVYDNDGNHQNLPPTESGYTDETGVFRANLAGLSSITGDIEQFVIYLRDVGDSFKLDYVKFYSMINWTYDTAATNNLETAVAYYDDTENALVLEKEFDSSLDYMSIKTENTSIGYATTNMVVLVTAKASVNNSVRLRLYAVYDGASDTASYAYLHDYWEIFTFSLSGTSNTLRYFKLYLRELSSSSLTGTYKIFIKDNITIRPSWYDASYDSYEADMTYSYAYGVSPSEHGGKYHDSIWEQWMVCTDTGNEYTKYESSILDVSSDYWLGARYRVESTDVEVSLAAMDGDGTYKFVVSEQRNVEWHETWVYLGDELDDIHVLFTYIGDASDSLASGNYSVYFDWIVLTKQPNVSGDVYSESFANVDEWISYSGGTFSTDGDVISVACHGDFNADFDGAGTNAPALYGGGYYVEARAKISAIGANVFRIRVYEDDGYHNTSTFLDFNTGSTSWQTVKRYVDHDIESVLIYVSADSGEDYTAYVDYIRIARVDKFGWQHDCSIIGGIRGIDDQSDWKVDVTSDGDVLTFNMTRVGTGSDYWCDIRFPIEAAGSGTGTDDNDIERDYYEFFAWKVRFVSFTSDFVLFYAQVDGAQPAAGQTDYIYSTNAVNDGEWHILRYNMKIYSSTTTAKQFRWYFYGNDVGDNIIVQIDWVKAYTLTNWTYSDTATNNKHTAVAYYDDSESSLVLEKKFDSSDDYLALSNDLLDDNDYIPLYVKATIKASANGVCLVGLKRGSGTEDIKSLTTSWQTFKFILFDASGDIYLYLRDADSSSGTYRIYIKDIVAYDYDPDGMDNYYSESFADVSDWSYSYSFNLGAGDYDLTTDGDVGALKIVYDSADDEVVIYNSDSFGLSGTEYYIEGAYYVSDTDTYARILVRDSLGNDYAALNYGDSTNLKTFKAYLGSSGLNDVDKVRIVVSDVGTSPASGTHYAYFDYIRIAPADQMGWQHDGSTTAGVLSSSTASYSSDGDLLTISASGSTQYVDLVFDTTSTVATGSFTYYPFLEFTITSATDNDLDGGVWYARAYDAGYTHNQDYSTSYSDDTGTFRMNLEASTYLGNLYVLRLYCDAGDSFTLDWAKLYSIANFTWQVSSYWDSTSDVAWVEDGTLYWQDSGSNSWTVLNYDPMISVPTSTYNVVNVTCADSNDAADYLYFSEQNTGWRNGDWRFESSDIDTGNNGYVNDLYIGMNGGSYGSTFIISAVKFWTDYTAPSIQEKWQVPDEPTISDDLKLFVIAEESVSIYQVSVSVLQAPSGFALDSSQLSRLSDDGITEVWSGIISSNLLEGDYVLRIDVTDGANSDYGYIVFTVTRDSYTGYIRIFDSLGDYIPFETFEVWRNGSRQYTDTFSAYADEAYQITVKDRFGQTLNTTTFAVGTREFVLVVNVYSLKVMSWYSDFVRFNITRGGVTYSEIITPLEVVNFRLYSNTYDYAIDYLNGTSISGNINLTNSTAIIVTGSTISDVYALTTNVYQMTNHINITTTTTSNNVYTIQLMFDWTNTTLYNQTVSIIAAFNWDNTTLYNQTITLGALFNSTNTVLYNQIVLIQNMFNWQNTTLYNQTVSILNQLSNVNSTLYSQTVSILANISNVNSTIYGQTVTILNNLANVNSTLYSQTLQILTNISNVNTTLYGQTLSILSDIVNVNSTLYSQTLQILTNVSNVNSTIYSQTVTILNNINNVNSTLYSQTVDILSDIYNTNSTLYSQTVSILSDISNTNSTLYSQAIDIISKVQNVNSTIYNQILTVLDNLDDLNATIYMTDDPSNLHPVVLGNTMSDEYCDFVIVTNWHNTTISIYDNDVLQVSGVSELVMPIRYELLQTYGVHNLSVYVDGGADSFWYNISYAFYANQGYGESVVTLYNSRGTGFDPSAYVLYVNSTRYADWTFYDRTNAVYNITITDYFGRVIYSGMHNYSRYIDIGVSFYTFKVYSQMSEEFVYFNLTAPNGARYSQHIGPGEVVTYYLVSGTYYYAFTRTNGPNEDLYSGQITLNADSSFIITDVSLKEILVAVQQDISARPNLEPMMSSIDSVMSSINMLQTSMWLFGAVIIGIMVISVYAKDSETVKSLSTRARGKKRKGEVPEQLKPYVFKPGPENPNYRGYVSKDKLKDWREYYES